MTYRLIDSGNGKKLEQFGARTLLRPCAQAVWRPILSKKEWNGPDGHFTREGGNRWVRPVEGAWEVEIDKMKFHLTTTDFGHVGVFPEQAPFWKRIGRLLGPEKSLLNLFAYSGGATLAAARTGANVCHVDASKGMIEWARINAKLNALQEAPIRWIEDDVRKFLEREIRRGKKYDAIVLDPPNFGRGPKGQIFKIEEELVPLLEHCVKLLSDSPLFIYLSCHASAYSPIVMEHVMKQGMGRSGGAIETGEMVIEANPPVYSLPCGTYAWWAP